MPVISNTSPILNLAIIDKLFLLRKQFGEIMVPPGVLEELRIDEELPGSRIIREAVKSRWIKVQRVNDIPLIRMLQCELDKGESEAIALALQTDAEIILLDEKEARRTAKLLGLKVTGLLGVILHARKDGDLESISHTVMELREKACFRISQKLLADINDRDWEAVAVIEQKSDGDFGGLATETRCSCQTLSAKTKGFRR